jgi:hypothetical protein
VRVPTTDPENVGPDRYTLSVLAAASGDGIIHELINGLAIRPDAGEALKIPIVPIPTGKTRRSKNRGEPYC